MTLWSLPLSQKLQPSLTVRNISDKPKLRDSLQNTKPVGPVLLKTTKVIRNKVRETVMD